MISIFAAIVTTVLILIPSVPLFIYVVGLLLPEEHTVSRSATLHTTADKIWSLLTHVQDYPSWQPGLDRIECTREENVAEQQVVFVEYTKRNKRITTVVDAAGHRILSRMTEEDSTTNNANTATAHNNNNNNNTLKHKPTFIGTWTFDITESKEQDGHTTITITEKGVITRPMVRLLHMTLLGFHRRIDRFLKDLENKIHHDAIMQEPMVDDKEQPHVDEEQLSNAINQDVTENNKGHDEEEVLSQESITPSTTRSNDSSPTVDKEWDLMSEIYERPNAHA